MGYSKQVVDKVKDEFARKRQNAVAAAEARREEMYAAAPVLREIDAALSATGLKIYRAALEGKEGLEERIAALKKENLGLQDDRRRVLEACGKPGDYLSIRYECPICEDTGYNGIQMCECMRKALIREAYHSSGLGAVLAEQTFDNFELSYYSAKKDANGISARDNMANILAEAKRYVAAFGSEEKAQNLLFIGKTGLGKTHISTAIAGGVIDKGYDVVYDTVQNILHSYELQTFSQNAEAAQNVARYTECALLVIDDLGTEFKNSFTNSVLYNLLNTRIIAGLPMIINTNLDDSALFKKQYDDRIISRLIGNFRTFKFFGEDIRIRRAVEKKQERL